MLRHLGDQADAYPVCLEQRFPHVLARIADLWGTRQMDAYFHSLMVSDRPNREGFPAEVAREIFRISMIHSTVVGEESAGGGWTGLGNSDIERWRQQR